MWLLLACVRTVAPPLEVSSTVAVPEPDSPEERLPWMLAGDPLARRPRVPSGPVTPGVAAFLDVDRRADPKPAEWFALEAAHRGTEAVPLARGARLGVLEVSLDDPGVALAWSLPLVQVEPREGQTRGALDWLVGPNTGLIDILERAVLLGWLDGPAIPVDAAARALQDARYDRLAARPAGALLLARAERRADPVAAERGRTLLSEATRLALLEVAADRDAEEKAWRVERSAAATTLGVEGDPISALLAQANVALTADAGSDTSTGLALTSQAALRLRGACPDTPCSGFDRLDALHAAARWGAGPWPILWEIIAEKDALDQLRSAWDTPFVAAALDKQVELLLGRGASLESSLLRYPTATPPVRLALSRALDAGDLTSSEDLLVTLKGHLIERAKTALPQAPERLREPLERIARRGG